MATWLGTGFANDERTSMGITAGTSIAEVIVSATAMLATLIGMMNVFPIFAASAAAIAIGAALLFEGGAIGARFADTLRRREGDSLTMGDVAGGLTAEVIAGVAGIVLGGLALVGVAPMAMLSTAALVYAAGLLIGCAALAHMMVNVGDDVVPRPKHDIVLAAAAAQLVVGIGAAILGITALLGVHPLALTLVALLFIAASEVLSGVALGSRTMRLLRARR